MILVYFVSHRKHYHIFTVAIYKFAVINKFKCFFAENKIDGFALAALCDISDLMKVIPEVAPGYIVRIYSSLKRSQEEKSCEGDNNVDLETDFCTISITDTGTSQSENDKSIPPLLRTDSIISGVELVEALLPSSMQPSTSTADSVTDNQLDIPDVNGIATDVTNTLLPVPKEFPIDLCEFGYYAKELIQTGNLT